VTPDEIERFRASFVCPDPTGERAPCRVNLSESLSCYVLGPVVTARTTDRYGYEHTEAVACPVAEAIQCARHHEYQAVLDARRRRAWERCGIPPRHLDADLNFHSDAAARVRRYLSEEKNNGVCLVLLGATGVGKTAAACAALMTVGGEMVYAGDILRRSLDDSKALDATIRRKGLLVLDDLGKEYAKPDGFVEAKIEEVFHHREAHLLPTIVTANLSPEGLRQRYSDSIVDRLRGSWGRVHVAAGSSFRV
jgi:DNA replication protein DnaC